MEKGLEPGNNRQCDINLVLEESEPEKGNKTETNFSVWSNREQGSSVRANRWPGVWVVGWSHHSYRFIIMRTSTISDFRQA